MNYQRIIQELIQSGLSIDDIAEQLCVMPSAIESIKKGHDAPAMIGLELSKLHDRLVTNA